MDDTNKADAYFLATAIENAMHTLRQIDIYLHQMEQKSLAADCKVHLNSALDRLELMVDDLKKEMGGEYLDQVNF